MMELKSMTGIMLTAIEEELRRQINRLNEPRTQPFHEILTYHMGWTGEGAGPEAQGKRIRPLLVLLTCAACHADWKPALPAAAAVELVHNFSLVHDDIQDKSERRRGRLTVWKKWGMPQAINTGDALFVLSNQAILDLLPSYPIGTVIQLASILHSTCLNLTRGQYLDMAYETRTGLTVDDYWPMVSGKTASLLSACTAIGALLGGADESAQDAYRSFGHYLGLAFQVQDDFLGTWGDAVLMGKSSESDLITGKKSLPILYGLEKNSLFAQRWAQGSVLPEEVSTLTQQLTESGAKLYTQETADRMTDLALQFLQVACPENESGSVLYELAGRLLNRET